MNHHLPSGHPWCRGNNRSSGSSTLDSWYSIDTSLSWRASVETSIDDLSLDSWHSTNGTWGSYSSLGTLSSVGTIFSDSEESIDHTEEDHQGVLGLSRAIQGEPGVPDPLEVQGGTSLVQSDLPGDSGGRSVRDSHIRRGGRSCRGICDGGSAAWSPELGAWRAAADQRWVQSRHRSETRPLDPLARRHWAQLGLIHRRPDPPTLRPPVLQLPLLPLQPPHPHIFGIVERPMFRQPRVMWWQIWQ